MRAEKQTSKLLLISTYVKPTIAVVLAVVLYFGSAIGQDCGLTLSGTVIDLNTDSPVDHAHCVIAESGVGTATNEAGQFTITDLCPGNIHLVVSHIGCATQQIFVPLKADTTLTIYLDHHAIDIGTITVASSAENMRRSSISQKAIRQSADRPLADILSTLEGVSVLRNGTQIGKPIVNGLFGNRLQILNSGVPHVGQNWGNDHAPEIDPSMIGSITLLEGAIAVREQATSLGAVVQIDRPIIKKDPHLHGNVQINGGLNGRRIGTEASIYSGYETWSWRLSANAGSSGDRRAPDYYLRNTGSRLLSGSGELHYYPNEKIKIKLLASHYDTEIGILRSSHIGNLTDLETSLQQEVPFFTESAFRRDITSPRQDVGHTMGKVSLVGFLSDDSYVEMDYSLQINRRKEFDVRRGNRSDRPTLSLQQIGQYFVTRYVEEGKGRLDAGIQVALTNNENGSGTGILPLIPNYLSLTSGAYAYYQLRPGKWQIDLGGRFDNTVREVAAISSTLPREIVRYDESFYNYQVSADIGVALGASSTMTYLTSVANRHPQVNELYAQGLHQGVSGIEEGNLELQAERSILQALRLRTKLGDKVHLRTKVYHRWINDYIYLRPTQELRLTIRGAFPVYQYTQTDARLYGWDATTSIDWSDRWSSIASMSLIRSDDLSSDIPLVNIPTDHGRVAMRYTAHHAGQLSELSLEIGASHHAAQSDLLAEIELVSPPAAYTLVDFNASAEYQAGSKTIVAYVRGSNLLNTSYRNYLNRLRYFADETGIDISAGIDVRF